jgi:hypothetical protein
MNEIETLKDRMEARKAEARKQYIASLREFADFCEANPGMPPPYPTQCIFCDDREEFLRIARLLARGARIEKKIDTREDGDFTIIRKIGILTLRVTIPRKKLCRLIQEAVYDCPLILEETADSDGLNELNSGIE